MPRRKRATGKELIRALKPAHDELIDVEKLSDEELKQLDDYYQRVRAECERRKFSRGRAECISRGQCERIACA